MKASMAGPDRKQRDVRGLSELLANHVPSITSERVSLADIADFLGTRSDLGMG
jgi:hypothetical protein